MSSTLFRAAHRAGGLLAAAIVVASCARGGRGAPRAPAPKAPQPGAPGARPAAKDTTARRDTAAARDTARRDTTLAAPPTTPRAPTKTERAPQPCDLSLNQEVAEQQNARASFSKLPSGKYNAFIGGTAVARCAGQNNVLRADSAEQYADNGILLLIGNVHYEEPNRVKLDAQRMTYFTNEEHVIADGNVVAVSPSGTTMRTPTAEYFRVIPGVRPLARLLSNARPVVTVVEKDSLGRPTTPTEIVANSILDEGDSLVYASGAVQMTRTDVIARSDSATFDKGSETARLLRNASIEGKQGRPFTLFGATIDLFTRGRQLERVLAQKDARIVSQELTLKSDFIDLRLTAGQLQRAYAWGPSRAVAISPEQEITADSIEVLMPGQRVQQMRAFRRAVALSRPDSLRITSKERDMLAGDTVIARFDTMRVAGDTSKPKIRQVDALGHASSKYQIANSDGPKDRPSINYVRGRTITVAIGDSGVQTVTVRDSAAGMFLEPSKDTIAGDSTRRAPVRATPSAGRAPTRTPPVPPATRPPTAAPSMLHEERE